MNTLLEESLRRFEDAEAKEQTPKSNATGPLHGETEGIEAIEQCAPSVSANPSSYVVIRPSEAQPIVGSGLSGNKDFKEEGVWQSFFNDPSQWWNNRFDKRNPRAPDFKHKIIRKALWVSGRTTLDWVCEKFLSSLNMSKAESRYQSTCEVVTVL